MTNNDEYLFDAKVYSYVEAQKLENCQICGKVLKTEADDYYNSDYRTCHDCFGKDFKEQ